MLPELQPLLRQSVTIAPRSSIDGYGEITYGAAVTYRARVAGQRKLVRGPTGEEVLSTHRVWLSSAAVVGAQDRITLSTGDVGSTETGALQPPILEVYVYADETGRKVTVLDL